MTGLPNGFLLLPKANERTMEALDHKLQLLVLKAILKIPVDVVTRRTSGTIASLHNNLISAVREHKKQVLMAIGHLDVMPPMLSYLSGVRPAEEMLELALPSLMLRLYRVGGRSLVKESMLFEKPIARLLDEHLNQVYHFPVPAKGLLVQPTGAEVLLHDGRTVVLDEGLEHPEVRVERCFSKLNAHPGLRFSTCDSNPLSMFEAHPDKAGNAITLGEKTKAEWIDTLNRATALIEETLPHWFVEMPYTSKRLVPVGYEAQRHLSASYREAPGLCYLTLHPDLLTMSEAIIHETQHTKANMMSWLDAIIQNGHTCWTESPVRPDLRPLWGVLLAIHAFIPVSAFHHRLAELDHPLAKTAQFDQRRAEVIAGNRHGLTIVMENAKPTKAGQKLIDDMQKIQVFLEKSAPLAPQPLAEDLLPPG
jgi:hypothetical protein